MWCLWTSRTDTGTPAKMDLTEDVQQTSTTSAAAQSTDLLVDVMSMNDTKVTVRLLPILQPASISRLFAPRMGQEYRIARQKTLI